jgi:hypothetical protein
VPLLLLVAAVCYEQGAREGDGPSLQERRCCRGSRAVCKNAWSKRTYLLLTKQAVQRDIYRIANRRAWLDDAAIPHGGRLVQL